MASGYPALMIRQPESPLQEFSQVQQIRSGQQQQQMQALQIQQEQQRIKDQHALTSAMTQWDGQDYKTLPMQVLKAGGSGAAAMQISGQVLDIKAKASEIAKNDALTAQANIDAHIKSADEYRGRLLNIASNPDPAAKQAAWDAEVTKEEQTGSIQPGQVSHTYPGDDQAKALANNYALGSKIMEEQKSQQQLALEAWKPVGGGLVNAITGQKIGGIPDVVPINKGLEARWQVLHPGEALPDYYQLKPGANPADFDRVDKLLEATERGAATKAQRDQTMAMRQQTFELMREKTDLQAVTGIDPKTGRQVMVPLPQAQQMGIQNAVKMEGSDVSKVMAGRQWLQLANRQADPKGPPEEMGISQLIDKLDSEGKLGPIASRWNEFMAGKVGAGDSDVSALRAKMGLSTTLLMQAHVGNRGSSQMLEHFEDLANQKKLDGPTLKAAFGAEKNYIEDRAMDPNPPNYGAAPNVPKAGKGSLSLAEAKDYLQKAGGDKDKARELAKNDGRTF